MLGDGLAIALGRRGSSQGSLRCGPYAKLEKQRQNVMIDIPCDYVNLLCVVGVCYVGGRWSIVIWDLLVDDRKTDIKVY